MSLLPSCSLRKERQQFYNHSPHMSFLLNHQFHHILEKISKRKVFFVGAVSLKLLITVWCASQESISDLLDFYLTNSFSIASKLVSSPLKAPLSCPPCSLNSNKFWPCGPCPDSESLWLVSSSSFFPNWKVMNGVEWLEMSFPSHNDQLMRSRFTCCHIAQGIQLK